MNENKFFKKVFGTVSFRLFALVLMAMALIVTGIAAIFFVDQLFSRYTVEIAHTAAQLLRERRISTQIYIDLLRFGDRAIGELVKFISAILIFSSLISFFFIDWATRRFVKAPLVRIGNQALLISENIEHLGDQIEEPLFKEMKTFTDTFNVMSAALKKQMLELEERVQARTAELEAAKQKMEHMAKHDALTGLPNRWLFDEQFEQALRMAFREKVELTLLMIDLDNFKQINDTHGHLVGDEVLKKVAQGFIEALRRSDLISRWGGDEFAILLYDVFRWTDVKKIVEKIFSLFDQPVKVGEHQFNLKLSVGAARFPNDGEKKDTLIKHADAALYRAKETRCRHSSCFFGEIQAI